MGIGAGKINLKGGGAIIKYYKLDVWVILEFL